MVHSVGFCFRMGKIKGTEWSLLCFYNKLVINMQVPREKFYEACMGNPPIKVPAWWTSSPCAKSGIGVQTLPHSAESRWMGKDKWVHQVIARSDLVVRWKMGCPGCSWGVWHWLGLGSNWYSQWKRTLEKSEIWNSMSLCHCSARELGLLLLLHWPLLLLKNTPVNEGVWELRSCWNGS